VQFGPIFDKPLREKETARNAKTKRDEQAANRSIVRVPTHFLLIIPPTQSMAGTGSVSEQDKSD